MNEKPLITVIIPVYQVEKYLRRAVDSVLQQTYTNLEIILVDDGSKDGCGDICDEYASREARVRTIHKENGGLSDARNAGLDVAGGDYIAFLDSDDYYAPFFIEVLYREICRGEAEVVVCKYVVTDAFLPSEGPDFSVVKDNYEKGQYCREVFGREQMLLNQYDALCKDATYFIVAWNKLYKASLWKGIRFPKGKIHEDEATIYRIFDKIQTGIYINIPMYAYFTLPDSITRARFRKERLQWFDGLDDRIRFFEKKGEVQCVKAALRSRADAAIRYYYPLKEACPRAGKEKRRLKNYVRDALYRDKRGDLQERKFLPLSTRAGYRLFLVSPGIYRVIMKVRK